MIKVDHFSYAQFKLDFSIRMYFEEHWHSIYTHDWIWYFQIIHEQIAELKEITLFLLIINIHTNSEIASWTWTRS